MVSSKSARQIVALDLDPDGLMNAITIDGFTYDMTGGPLGGPVLSDDYVEGRDDGVSRLMRVADRRGSEWTLGYDYRDLMIMVEDPLGGRTDVVRNQLGNIVSRIDPEGLYYTAVLHGDRLCATYCADVTVVCVNAPE